MSGRTLAILAALAAAAVAGFVVLGGGEGDEEGRGGEAGQGDGAGTAGDETPGGALPGGTLPPRVRAGADGDEAAAPRRPPQRPALRATSPLDEGFEAETRDEAWAAEVEKEVAARLDELLPGYEGVDVPRAECRGRSCRVIVTATDERNFQRFVEALQGERGFYGFADMIALGKPEAHDGRVEMSIVLSFERRE